jgi:signal transduction histidine kinase
MGVVERARNTGEAMAQPTRPVGSTLRGRMILVLSFGILALAICAAVTSHYILRHTFARAELPADVIPHVSRLYLQMLTGLALGGFILAAATAAFLLPATARTLRRLFPDVTKTGKDDLAARTDVTSTDELRRVADINEELTHFAYIVSHDLKAPLRGIKLIAEWLCADYGDRLGDEGRQQLDLLQSRVERMHNLIEGVLQYSRVGRIKESWTSVDLNRLLPDIVDDIAPPDHVEVALDGRLPVIECERTRITQVFQNLLTNAVKYMDKPHGRVEVACVQRDDVWQFSVRDNGPGIEEKHFERIFRIFQTLAPRDEFESTGVGLALVKKIVEMYGGRVWVESEVGRGSTFAFTLPVKKTQTCGEPLPTGSAQQAGSGEIEQDCTEPVRNMCI